MTARSTTNATGTFDELVARFEPPAPLLAQSVRRLVHDVMPCGVRELVEVAGTHRVPPLPPAG
jgi:hypothetical protein